MNTFTVIKHSSEIQHWSGRQFPLQSYVLLRASMGLGLTLIFFVINSFGGLIIHVNIFVCEALS